MAQKLINSLKFSANGDEYVISLPTVTGTPSTSGVLTISNADTANIVLEEGAMFNYIGHCTSTGTSATPFSLNSITSIIIGSTSYNVVKGEGLTTVYGPVTYLYSGGKWRVVESHKHSAAEVGAAPANHTHELDIDDHTFTPAGTVTATFNGKQATITSSAPSVTAAVLTKVEYTGGAEFSPNTPTQVDPSTTNVVKTLNPTTMTGVIGVALKGKAGNYTHSVVTSASLSGSVSGKCLTLSINTTGTQIFDGNGIDIAVTTSLVLSSVTATNASVVGSIDVTPGTPASYTQPSLKLTTGYVASSSHTHTTTHKPEGTISATFAGTTATLTHEMDVSMEVNPETPQS